MDASLAWERIQSKTFFVKIFLLRIVFATKALNQPELAKSFSNDLKVSRRTPTTQRLSIVAGLEGNVPDC